MQVTLVPMPSFMLPENGRGLWHHSFSPDWVFQARYLQIFHYFSVNVIYI